jgi:hypothetical protein
MFKFYDLIIFLINQFDLLRIEHLGIVHRILRQSVTRNNLNKFIKQNKHIIICLFTNFTKIILVLHLNLHSVHKKSFMNLYKKSHEEMYNLLNNKKKPVKSKSNTNFRTNFCFIRLIFLRI